ncbi:hypothetical protein [Pseudoduganella albidiflava]|uniref:CHAT domain-containing protein n=1 Tax=Pseudoduganella albidiflava TaxID=321983 RepID=A0A411WSM3_9BURK|nr:hypothetical protein [Pseudoduganella albidiflava]QBH99647.1 hypothetical protein EYF70_01405 [Pseudoduganella albidiflava]GGY46526.1 hypothetical protein GCM10007387_30830 [Pseudoduganella albidiflava]
MKKPHASRAILVFESPWELDGSDANRSSVLPFVEGVAKYAGDTEVFHANFYDESSFDKALDCLCKTRYRNAIVYIAAHGDSKSAGNVKLHALFALISLKSQDFNITGVVLGSCFTGSRSFTLEAGIEQSAIRWCAGYASSVGWLTGTMIDCAILAAASRLKPADFTTEKMVKCFGGAIAPFSPTTYIGKDEKEDPVALEDSLQFVVQPSGQGHKAKNVSAAVFEEQAEYH